MCVGGVMLSRQVSRVRLRYRDRWGATQICSLWFNFTPINWRRRSDILFYVYFVMHNVCQFETKFVLFCLKMIQSSILPAEKSYSL